MARRGRSIGLIVVLLFAVSFVVAAQDSPAAKFGLGLGIGSESFNEPGQSQPVAWQMLTLNPDLAIGPFGIGLDVTLHYRFNGGPNANQFEIRPEDWIPAEPTFSSFLQLYLPMFRYIRWGERGDPLYVKLGSIDDATLGNGFIMSNYANTLFLPDKRIFGMDFDLDGNLFKFPYVGFQSFVGNLAHPDVVGGRLYVRPMLWSSIPIVKNIQVGGTVVADFDPGYYLTSGDVNGDGVVNAADQITVAVFGADFQLPILTSKAVSLAAFGSIAKEYKHGGAMLGFGGKLFNFLPYGFQLRILGENFIPSYFNSTYDLYRASYYQVVTSDTEVIPASAAWFASTGFSFLDDKLSLNISLNGPFVKNTSIADTAPEAWVNFPHLYGVFNVAEGLIPGFSFNASYDKRNIQSFADLISPENAKIGASVSYQTGPAVLTLEYDLRYDPNYPGDGAANQWQTTATLKTSISLF